MKTKDLIKKLQELDPEGEMEIWLSYDCMPYSLCYDDIKTDTLYISNKDGKQHWLEEYTDKSDILYDLEVIKII